MVMIVDKTWQNLFSLKVDNLCFFTNDASDLIKRSYRYDFTSFNGYGVGIWLGGVCSVNVAINECLAGGRW